MERNRATLPTILTLPDQTVSSLKKMEKKWQEDTVNYYIQNGLYLNRTKRKSISDMNNNWAIINSTIGDDFLSEAFDPLDILKENQFNGSPMKLQFYNVVNSSLQSLVGEGLKRKNDARAIVLNDSIINQKDRIFRERLYNYLNELAKQPSTDPTRIQEELTSIDKWKKHDLQTAHEVMANQIIQMISNDSKIDFKSKINNSLFNLAVVAEAILRVGNIGKELSISEVDGRFFHVIGMGKSNRIEDGVAWIEEDYMNINKIIEEFGRILPKSDIKRLYDYHNEFLSAIPVYDKISVYGSGEVDNDELYLKDITGNTINDTVDKDGNIRVLRVFFLSLRKIKELTYYDQFGDAQTIFVDEYYEPNILLGETVEEFYINELWQGYNVLNDIFFDIKPCDVQMRSLINPAIVRPPYVGIVKSEGGGCGRGILDDMLPYQKDFTIWMNKLKLLWVQNIGKVANIDINMIPEKMEMEEWFYWMKTFKINFQNKFNESDKGYISGNMQLGSKDIELDISNEIMQAINTLEWLKQQIEDVSGINRQRTGQIAPSDGLGTTQQAILQSSNKTEKDFYLIDLLQVRTLEVAIEYVKVLWKNEKGKRQYLLDDVSNYVFDLDGELLNEGEYGIYITNSSRLYEIEQMLQQLTHAAIQTGTATLTDVARMKMATSPSEMLNQLSVAEEKRLKQQQESQKMQLESQEKQQQMMLEMEKQKHQWDLEKMQMEWNYKLEEIKLRNKYEQQQRAEDTNYNWIKDEVENDMNIRDNETKLKDIETNKMLKEKELQIKKEIELKKINAQKNKANK